ncbi:MAG: hypothetical protein IJU01_01645 [Lachnospiraceae bacterium]|nr:hypothetical protein [Lachnospiraceae bacterium]
MKIKRFLIAAFCVSLIITGSFSSAAADTPALTGAQAREKVWTMMWRMATVKWSPSSTVYYEHQSEQIAGKTYSAGTVYVGMPYTQSSKSIDLFIRSFNDFDNDGVLDQFKPWVPVQYTSLSSENIDTIDILMGNDCSGAVYWAMATVADVTFRGTRMMMPAKSTGLAFLDDSGNNLIDVDEPDYSRAAIGDLSDPARESAVRALMYNWYDSMQKGDVVVANHEKGFKGAKYVYGHTMMVESVDPVNQKVTILQHGGPGAEWKKLSSGDFDLDYSNKNNELKMGGDGTVLWNYGEMSYEDLFELYYVPLTLPEYSMSEISEGQVSIDNKNTGKLYLASGIVTATKGRLASLTVEIKNEDGTLLDSVTLDTAVYRWRMYRDAQTQRIVENTFDMTTFGPYLLKMGMKAGETYRYKLTAHLADETDHVLKEFMFVY